MAKRLEEDELQPFQQAGLYPWDRWFDGAVWIVERGEDFQIAPLSFRTQIHRAAHVRGGVASTSIDGDKVKLQFHPDRAGRVRVDHRSCSHPPTRSERAKCRVQRDLTTPHHPELRED